MRKLTNLEIMKARNVSLTEMDKTAKAMAEKCVHSITKMIDGKRVGYGWSVDTYAKQLYKMQVLMEWFNTPLEANERTYMGITDMDIIGQLELADFDDETVKAKARLLYRKYLTFCEMLEDRIKEAIHVAGIDDLIEKEEIKRLPYIPDKFIQ